MNKLYIRADGNRILGLGHLMRCMSIADAVCALGVGCEFIVADSEGAEAVRERGFRAHILQTDYRELESELAQMKDFLQENKVELLLVDSYFATQTYFKELHPYTKLVYLTGRNSVPYDVDAIIDYTVRSEEKGFETVYQDLPTKLLLGVQYAPLRKQFEVPWNFRNKVENILVTTGATDGEGFPVKLLEQIEKSDLNLDDCHWHIVQGKFYSETVKEQLEEYAKRMPIAIYNNVSDMASLMQKCDLAISAGGSTLYELCACGIPTVAFSFVDNQVRDLDTFFRRGYIYSAGDTRGRTGECIEEILTKIAEWKDSEQVRKEQATKMKAYIDGKGASRLAEELCRV